MGAKLRLTKKTDKELKNVIEMHNLALDKCQIESFYGLLRLLIFIVSIFWHSKFCVESLSITFFNKSFSLFSSVTKYQFNSEGIYLAVVIYYGTPTLSHVFRWVLYAFGTPLYLVLIPLWAVHQWIYWHIFLIYGVH